VSRNGRIALISAAVIVAVVAFVLIRSDDNGGGGQSLTSTAGAPAAPATQRLTIRHGKPVGGVRTITVSKGDTVRLTVSSADTSQEIHVHGYDLKRDMAPGRPASFRFKAGIEGAFEIELEQTATKIANLQVRPG
jgi:FtsP/CotA-like multicopper oxidase with cupredoxin domain